jgi:hypothetical protein
MEKTTKQPSRLTLNKQVVTVLTKEHLKNIQGGRQQAYLQSETKLADDHCTGRPTSNVWTFCKCENNE